MPRRCEYFHIHVVNLPGEKEVLRIQGEVRALEYLRFVLLGLTVMQSGSVIEYLLSRAVQPVSCCKIR